MDLSDLPALASAVGHHFIPKQVWANIDKTSNAYRVFNRTVSDALKNPKLSNSYDALHRKLNRQVDKVLRDLEKDLGKSVEDFDKGDFEALGERLEASGEDVAAFNERLYALEPQATRFADALAQALEEVFPAAADAASQTAETAGTAAEAAAESGIE